MLRPLSFSLHLFIRLPLSSFLSLSLSLSLPPLCPCPCPSSPQYRAEKLHRDVLFYKQVADDSSNPLSLAKVTTHTIRYDSVIVSSDVNEYNMYCTLCFSGWSAEWLSIRLCTVPMSYLSGCLAGEMRVRLYVCLSVCYSSLLLF